MLPQSPQAYQIPPQDSSAPTLLPIINISDFSNRYAQILSADSPNQLAEAFENKIREHINYQNEKFKELILIGLAIIDKKLCDPNVKTDEKVAICSKLQERVGQCPHGFVTGLQMINLQIPQSTIIDVLYQMRYDIVNSTALQHLKDSWIGNEIHFVNAYFKTANEHGLGVLWEKADNYSPVQPEYFVHLQQSFNEKYQFEAIWKTLMDKIEEGYKNNSREEWIARLKVLMPQLQEVDDHYQRELHRIAEQKELAKQPLKNLADIDEINLNLVVSTTQDALQKQSENFPNNRQIQKALAFHL